MNKTLFSLILLCFFTAAAGQGTGPRLQKAYGLFEKDEQLKHAISSLYVIDARTGQVVFEKNAQVGLAPASTQKVITSVTAFELLGKDFRYKTRFCYSGNLVIIPSGDPTFGSWRWENTGEKATLNRIISAIRKNKYLLKDKIFIDAQGWDRASIPDGWIWQDIGNYYGAGSEEIIWRENQYDIYLKSGDNEGDPVKIVRTDPLINGFNLNSVATSGPKGTGDNAYIYFPVDGTTGIVKGTIPVKENNFKISGAMPSGKNHFLNTLLDSLKSDNKQLQGWTTLHSDSPVDNMILFHTELSPSLDSIIYWFNKKSINLYGEALVKTFAYEKNGMGSTDSGVAIVRKFWKGKGIDEDELNIYDGSGLSPLNRVTTHAQVEILKYASTKDWFPYFLRSLPEYNGMTMKSGTISDVKGFCGYQKAKDGKEYIFSFLVNNYSGKTGQLVQKMYKVLDELK